MDGLLTWESAATVMALLYVILAARGNIWCWFWALGSTAIFGVILFNVNLLMDSALQAYYFAMAIYGYWQWNKGSKEHRLSVDRFSSDFHIKAIGLLAVISFALGYVMDNNTQADFPYLDTATTVFSVFATWLVARRCLENWLYWIVIDVVSIYPYMIKELYWLSGLFVIYVVIAVYGLRQWTTLWSYNESAVSAG